jgi:hypothetical protein
MILMVSFTGLDASGGSEDSIYGISDAILMDHSQKAVTDHVAAWIGNTVPHFGIESRGKVGIGVAHHGQHVGAVGVVLNGLGSGIDRFKAEGIAVWLCHGRIIV